jgi:hypothetical protein
MSQILRISIAIVSGLYKLSPLVSLLAIRAPLPHVLFIADFRKLKNTVLMWHNVDTIFRENLSVVSDF